MEGKEEEEEEVSLPVAARPRGRGSMALRFLPLIHAQQLSPTTPSLPLSLSVFLLPSRRRGPPAAAGAAAVQLPPTMVGIIYLGVAAASLSLSPLSPPNRGLTSFVTREAAFFATACCRRRRSRKETWDFWRQRECLEPRAPRPPPARPQMLQRGRAPSSLPFPSADLQQAQISQ